MYARVKTTATAGASSTQRKLDVLIMMHLRAWLKETGKKLFSSMILTDAPVSSSELLAHP